MSSRTSIIGAGAWGTAVAKVIAEKGIDVVIWALEEETSFTIPSMSLFYTAILIL